MTPGFNPVSPEKKEVEFINKRPHYPKGIGYSRKADGKLM